MPADSDDKRRRDDDVVKTEDLLAGFDRPARTPRTPPVNRDFVEYHLDKRRTPHAPVAPAVAPAPEAGRSRDMPTAIIPHAKPRWLAWLPWLILLSVLPIAGLIVAALIKPPAPRERASTPTIPSASAKALAPGSPPLPTASAAVTPEPEPTTVVTAPIEASPPRRLAPPPASAPSTAPVNAAPSATPSSSSQPPPNGEFIRVL